MCPGFQQGERVHAPIFALISILSGIALDLFEGFIFRGACEFQTPDRQ